MRGEDGVDRLQAEGFSSSIARILEHSDVDALPDARVVDGAVHVEMRNEALETHAVRELALMVVHGPPGSQPLRSFEDGDDFAVADARSAIACEAPEDGCDALRDEDRHELALESDGHDLLTPATIRLRFDPPPRRPALVLTARNSLMSTFVLYHMLALHGRSAPRFIAQLERGDAQALASLLRFGRRLGGVAVEVRQGHDDWRRAGELPYIGPIARATRALDLGEARPDEPLEVRLRFTRAHWRFDAVRLAAIVADDLQPDVIPRAYRAPT